ncbi:uncharacterized protein LOC121336659 [Onychostruthus taczanowskii]|uniref:uncharacterized protein LOC121336659 n=1 Tax=Onychostruthus taczanowskii TaxID=356909 RepID=UPI001B802CBC|nr:uncharacterized protein LOC121336659 [Onychostruthus taczanowskii]
MMRLIQFPFWRGSSGRCSRKRGAFSTRVRQWEQRDEHIQGEDSLRQEPAQMFRIAQEEGITGMDPGSSPAAGHGRATDGSSLPQPPASVPTYLPAPTWLYKIFWIGRDKMIFHGLPGALHLRNSLQKNGNAPGCAALPISSMEPAENQGRTSLGSQGNQERTSLVIQGNQSRTLLVIQGNQERTFLVSQVEQSRTFLVIEGNQERTFLVIQGNQSRTLLVIEGNQERTFLVIEWNQERTFLLIQVEQSRTFLVIEGNQSRTLLVIQGNQERTFLLIQVEQSWPFLVIEGNQERTFPVIQVEQSRTFWLLRGTRRELSQSSR